MISIKMKAPQNESVLPFVFKGKNMVASATINSNPSLDLEMTYVSDQIFFKRATDFTVQNRNGKSYIIINEFVLRDFYYSGNTTIDISIKRY